MDEEHLNKNIVFGSNQKCIVTITLCKSENNYYISYSYSNENHNNPFYKIEEPLNEHKDGDIIYRNSLTDIIIDYLMNDKDLYVCVCSDEIYKTKRTFAFDECCSFGALDYPSIICNYKIDVSVNLSYISILFSWDTFNSSHPEFNKHKGNEEQCMRHAIFPKNAFTLEVINYILMDDKLLSCKIGFSEVSDYRKRICRSIIPAIVKCENSAKTIMTRIIPILWD